MGEHSKLIWHLYFKQIKIDLMPRLENPPVCGRIRRRVGHEGGFHIISVKCFYLTAVTVLDKPMSAEICVVYYEVIFQTHAFKLDQKYAE